MDSMVQDVLRADLVLIGVSLLRSPEEFERFKDAVNSDVQLGHGFVADIQSGLTEPDRTFTLNRERVIVNASQTRSSVAKEYPSEKNPSDDFGRLAEVAAHAITHSSLEGQEPRAFGFNAQLVIAPTQDEPAIRYIGTRLFGPSFPTKEGWELVGGSGQLIFADAARRWTITLQPRPNDDPSSRRVNLSLNLHVSEPRLPTEAEIKESLNEIWDEARGFISRFHARE